MKRKILLGLLVVLVAIQFIPVDKTLPASSEDQDFFYNVSGNEEEVAMIKTACYDCHSNTTVYPWYSSIMPVSKWLQGHVETGRGNVNFSEWASYSDEDKKHALKECAEVLEKKEMPMLPYMMLHNDAWVNDEQRAQLAAYFKQRAAAL